MALSTKQKIVLGGGAALIIGLWFTRKKILAAIASAQAVPPTPLPNALPGMSGLGEDPSAFDKVAKTTNTAIQTLTGAIALGMGYFTLKDKKKALTAPAAAPVVASAPARRRRTKRR